MMINIMSRKQVCTRGRRMSKKKFGTEYQILRGLLTNRAVTNIMRFFFLMGIQGSFKNIFSRLEVCIKIFYYSRKTLRISVLFLCYFSVLFLVFFVFWHHRFLNIDVIGPI